MGRAAREGKCGKEARRLLVLVVVLILLFAIGVEGCHRTYMEAHALDYARRDLLDFCQCVTVVQHVTKETPPTSLPLIVEWLGKVGLQPYIVRHGDGTFKDRWGNPIRVVLRDGKFFGVGSPGPNGVWEEGAGDDVLVTLEDVK